MKPCRACRKFLYKLNKRNENMEIMVDFKEQKTVILKDLMHDWWGMNRH
ncbi:MAG: cytidine deaminase [Candidatus Fimenecus sp.]